MHATYLPNVHADDFAILDNLMLFRTQQSAEERPLTYQSRCLVSSMDNTGEERPNRKTSQEG